MAAHESFDRPEEIVRSSDRSFGFVFAGFFTIIGVYKLWQGSTWSWYWLAAAAAVTIVALLTPKLLAGPNRLWAAFGLLLARIMQPVVMALLFFLTVTPIAMLMRLFGKDPLRLRRDAGATSYWIRRDPPGPPPENMKNQF